MPLLRFGFTAVMLFTVYLILASYIFPFAYISLLGAESRTLHLLVGAPGNLLRRANAETYRYRR